MKRESNNGRRTFIKHSAGITGGILINTLPIYKSAYAEGSDVIKVGVIGCGGRGTGAAAQALQAGSNIRLVAMADVFEEQLLTSYQNLKNIEIISNQVIVPKKNQFTSFDGYKHVIEASDVVILATPPAFRPEHFEEAVKQGKHVFMEKPVACDSPGVRKILQMGELATSKNLKVVVGLQNRYDLGYSEMVGRIKEGQIGDITSSMCYFLRRQYPIVPRSSLKSELAFQIKNWHFFNWMWGGAPAGLQIHNTDIVNWVKDSYPIQAQGLGGRAVIDGPDTGEVYDHFYIAYDYADGSKIHSQISIMNNTYYKNGAFLVGTKGTANIREGMKNHEGNKIWRYRDKESPNPYQLEHDKLFDAILKDYPHNDTEFGAKSTLTAIMGRMACHSGQMINWEDALNSDLRLVPQGVNWETTPPILPDKNGIYPFPKPGITKVL